VDLEIRNAIFRRRRFQRRLHMLDVLITNTPSLGAGGPTGVGQVLDEVLESGELWALALLLPWVLGSVRRPD